MQDYILVGKNQSAFEAKLLLKYANRHGLITGATGTGKTITLQTIAEGFSNAGIPVFMADIKGDLQTLHRSSEFSKNFSIFQNKSAELNIDYKPMASPVRYWDCFGKNGISVRTTIGEIGPILLARMLQLNETQEGILNIAFRIADEQGLLLVDLKDLRSVLNYLSENAREISAQYGNIAPQSVATIQRALLKLETQGGDVFIGEPALDLQDLMKQDTQDRGIINILSAVTLMNSPDLYSSFLLWLLSEFYENLPEVGDNPKPKFIFFFDEAHLLFNDTSPALIQQIERVVRLIRSKGVGVYFVTQNPIDVPETILGQLSNRVQHALRAFSPRDQKSVKVAAETFRQNPAINTEETITNLGVGEALVSFPNEKGMPNIVEIVNIIPPSASQGACEAQEFQNYIKDDILYQKYHNYIDRVTAYEQLQKNNSQKNIPEEITEAKKEETIFDGIFQGKNGRTSVAETAIKSIIRNVASEVGRNLGKAIMRGILGGLKR